MKSSLTCEAVAHAGLGPPVRKAGSELLWRCPNHEDQHPSLSINPTKDCFMCGPCGVGGTPWQLAAFLGKLGADDKPAVTAWLRECGLLNGKREIVAVYDYRDERGNLLFQVVRYEPKDFRPRRPNSSGGWIWNVVGVRRVLYNLPEVLKSKSVHTAATHTSALSHPPAGKVSTRSRITSLA